MNKVILCIALSFLLYACHTGIQSLSQNIILPQQIENVRIDTSFFPVAVCEPSICIDPSNKDIIVAASVLNNVYTSTDGGISWDKKKLNSTYGVYGDPVIRADFLGDFYFAHLSNPTGRAYQDPEFLDRIVVQKSKDSGKTWTDGSFTKPSNEKDHDKHWLAIDPTNNHIYMTWTEFDKYGSDKAEDKSRILFSKSVNHGDSWSEPKSISDLEGDCVDDDETTEGAVPAVGPNGEVYVSWAFNSQLYFDKSLDGGDTWSEDKVIAEQVGGWTIDIPGIPRCNGMPITETDLSNGPYRGNIYVNYGDQSNGANDTDIWIVRSSDGGDNWSKPIRVNNDPPGKHQFLSWMDVDPMTGIIYIVFYDRRAHMDNATDVYLAYSIDGGRTFENKIISDQPFTPTPIGFFGDYNDISAYDGRIRPIWTRLDSSIQSVWTALIDIH